MEMQDGTEVAADAVSAEATEALSAPGPDATVGETPAAPTGMNPAWAPLQEALGDEFFTTHAVPVLKSMDESANSRITSLNAQLKTYEPYKAFAEQGVDVERLQMAMQVSDMLDSNPEQIYQFLKSRFEPEDQGETLEQYGAGIDGVATIPPAVQAQLDQLREAQQLQLQQQEHEARERQMAADIASLDAEMDAFIANTPGYSKDDVPELFQLRHELTQRLEKQGLSRMATMQEVDAEFNRRLSVYKARFAGAAPGTLPTTSGGSVAPTTVDVSKLSKNQMADLIAADLIAANKTS